MCMSYCSECGNIGSVYHANIGRHGPCPACKKLKVVRISATDRREANNILMEQLRARLIGIGIGLFLVWLFSRMM